MLCCRRSFPLTASCCLNSSFRGSARDGGGAICSHKGGEGGLAEAENLHQQQTESALKTPPVTPHTHTLSNSLETKETLVHESRGMNCVTDLGPERSITQL